MSALQKLLGRLTSKDCFVTHAAYLTAVEFLTKVGIWNYTWIHSLFIERALEGQTKQTVPHAKRFQVHPLQASFTSEKPVTYDSQGHSRLHAPWPLPHPWMALDSPARFPPPATTTLCSDRPTKNVRTSRTCELTRCRLSLPQPLPFLACNLYN